MKNMKTMMATLVLVMMIGVSSSFGGIYVTDRGISNEPAPATCDATSVNTGVILNGVILNGVILNGVILNGVILNGVILNGGAAGVEGPCTTGGYDVNHD